MDSYAVVTTTLVRLSSSPSFILSASIKTIKLNSRRTAHTRLKYYVITLFRKWCRFAWNLAKSVVQT